MEEPNNELVGSGVTSQRMTRRRVIQGGAALTLLTVPDCAAALSPIATKHIAQRNHPRLVPQLGHFTSVNYAALSPDGRYVLTAGQDTTVRLWGVGTGEEIKRFLGHTDEINSAVFSPNGKLILTSSTDKAVCLWNLETGEIIRRFVGHTEGVNSAIFSPDGRRILTASADKTARLWNAATGKEIRRFVGHLYAVSSAVFAPNGKNLLTASQDNTARLWDGVTGKEIRRFIGHEKGIVSGVFSSDGRYVLTAGYDYTARLWNTVTGKEVRRFGGSRISLIFASFSPDDKYVVTSGHSAIVRLWETTTGKKLREFEGHIEGTTSAVFSSDGKYILSASWDYTARLWNTRTGKEIRCFEGESAPVEALALLPDGKGLLTAGHARTFQQWDVDSGREAKRFPGDNSTFHTVVVSTGGKYALTSSWGKTARLWDMETCKEVRQFVGHSESVESAVFSSDERYVLTASRDKTARLWEAATGIELRRFTGHSDEVSAAVFTPDGTGVLTASRDFTIRLWDRETGKEIYQLRHEGYVNSVIVMSDGKQVLTASYDHTARLWDLQTGKELKRFEGHTGGVTRATFSPDERRILTASDDKSARLWDVKTGKELRRFSGHTDKVTHAIFTPDGKRVLTASDDSTVRLWDRETGKELCSLLSFRDGTWAVIDPEGRFDASNQGRTRGLHWVIGLEPVELSQLRAGFYEPGLLARIWKGAPPPFPVPDFAQVDVRLNPEVLVTEPKPGEHNIVIRLVNRGGGIGKVRVWVDGAILLGDARPVGFDPNAAKTVITVSLANVPALKPGQKRNIRVEAENAIGDVTIQGRGVECSYLPPQESAPVASPELWAIVIGISEYADPSLHLKYAAKDAQDFADALTLGAKKLYQPEHVHLTMLSSDAVEPTRKATRANIAAAFERVRKAAKATDVLVVYGAGHGVSLRLSEKRDDLYCYLTQEAHTNVPQDLANAAIRRTCAITSEDLVAWLNPVTGIKTNKKVILLDTCAAGAAEKMILTAARELTPEEVARARAINQLKDNTAFHVLMGCAADKVSYEAGEYGQGLLTYALLEGMKNTDRFIEVPGIFNYVEKRVPELAAGIGGVQKPQVASPQGATIQIGEMGTRERDAVRLAARKIRILAPTFLNLERARDTLRLTEQVELLLANESATAARIRGAGGFVYVGKGKLPGAIEPSGSYSIMEGKAMVRIVLVRDNQEVADFTLNSPAEPVDTLAKTIADAILEACAKLVP